MSKETEIDLKKIVTEAIMLTVIEDILIVDKNNPAIVFDKNGKMSVRSTYNNIGKIIGRDIVMNHYNGGCDFPDYVVISNIDEEIYKNNEEEIEDIIDDIYMDVLGDL